MYFFLIILLLVALICSVFFHFRKKKIVCKIQCMDKCQKCCKVEELVKPFGYCFHEECGFFQARWTHGRGRRAMHGYTITWRPAFRWFLTRCRSTLTMKAKRG